MIEASALSNLGFFGSLNNESIDPWCVLLWFVVLSNTCAACHAARPREGMERDMLVEDHQHTGLVGKWACNRDHRPHRPSDQGNGDRQQPLHGALQYRPETVLAETNQLDDVDRYDELEQQQQSERKQGWRSGQKRS